MLVGSESDCRLMEVSKAKKWLQDPMNGMKGEAAGRTTVFVSVKVGEKCGSTNVALISFECFKLCQFHLSSARDLINKSVTATDLLPSKCLGHE